MQELGRHMRQQWKLARRWFRRGNIPCNILINIAMVFLSLFAILLPSFLSGFRERSDRKSKGKKERAPEVTSATGTPSQAYDHQAVKRELERLSQLLQTEQNVQERNNIQRAINRLWKQAEERVDRTHQALLDLASDINLTREKIESRRRDHEQAQADLEELNRENSAALQQELADAIRQSQAPAQADPSQENWEQTLMSGTGRLMDYFSKLE